VNGECAFLALFKGASSSVSELWIQEYVESKGGCQ
jgi:hypothetical protein